MEFDVSLESEQQFWNELQAIVSTPCGSEDLIDNALRAYLSLATKYKDAYLNSELEISRCSYKLLSSSVFTAHTDYVRRQMIYSLLQEDDLDTLYLIISFLLFDGRQHEVTLQMMNEEGSFPRLLELLQIQQKTDRDNRVVVHRLLMDLLYEMSRIQRIKIEDLVLVDDEFIKGLFEIIEDLSYDASDPYHYPVIRVLLVLNEQFMISAHNPVEERSSTNSLTNKVIKVLSMHGNVYKTFGENIILLINREAETSLQLLTLKLLYLIFTTPSTYEYFYTNDLHVLVDILIRNLLDLPEEASALRHTYLRVLYPLLAHTQLKYPPHYKRDGLKRMLSIIVRGQLSNGDGDYERILHFEDVDETTRRLVFRCATVDWLRDAESDNTVPEEQATEPIQTDLEAGSPLETSQILSPASTVGSSPEALSPTRLDEHGPSKPDHQPKIDQIRRMGFYAERTSSTLSVEEVAGLHEKGGVIAPSRNDNTQRPTSPTKSPTKLKIKPEPPKSRRWRGRRPGEEDEEAPTSSPIIPSTPLTPLIAPTDRKDSTTTSSLAPPVPAHSRRSVSNPPPALPPPRRSVHHLSANCTPISSSPVGKHGYKPEPPKTRRSGRAKHAPTDSSDKTEKEGAIDEVQPETPVESHDDGNPHGCPVINVEEGVQNLSLE